MPVSSSTEHWIKPDALTINLNHFGDPDYLQVSVLAGAVVMAFKKDVIGYNAAHNYRTWPLEAANTYLETTSAYNVYARLTRSEVNARALVVYDTVLRDIEGREITYVTDEETGKETEQLGEASEDYYYIFLGKISSSVSESGSSVLREWESDYRSGTLETNQQQNDLYGGFERMFRPHYDDPLNPDKITWIEALTHLGVNGGVTMFVDNGSLDLPSLYDGLPIDWDTIYWELDENGKKLRLKAKVDEGALTLGGLLNVGEWANSTATEDRIMVQKKDSTTWTSLLLSEIKGTADFSNVKESGDGNAYTSFTLSEDKNTLTFLKGETFAKSSDLALKWTKDDTKIANWDTAFGWGDHSKQGYITKTYADETFVTIKTEQTITGKKNFTTGGLFVNGSQIVYDSTNEYWKLDGDLLVTGAVTMFANEGKYTPSTIMDAIATDNVNLKVINGVLTFVGETGGGGIADSVAWNNVTGKPTWITETKPEYNYSEIKNTPTIDSYISDTSTNAVQNKVISSKSFISSRGNIDYDSLDLYNSSTNPFRNSGSVGVKVYDSYGTHQHSDSLYTFRSNGSYLGFEIHQDFSANTFRIRSLKDTGGYTEWKTLAFDGDYLKLSGGTMAGTIKSQSIYPKTTNAYELGTSSYLWSNLHTKKMTIDGIEIKKSNDGVIYLDGNLVVTGAVTMFGTDSVTASTVMDGVNVDGTTIIKSGNKLMLNPDLELGGGGSSSWNELEGKPTTIAGYGITDAKILNGVITLGENTITPLTQADGDERYVDLTLSAQTISKAKTFKKGCWVLEGSETSTITNRHMGYSTWGNVSSPTLYGILNGIDFAWKDTHWVVGNIRGNSTDSYGFGIGKLHSGGYLTPAFRVTESNAYINGYVVLNKNNYNDYVPTLDGTGATGTWGISISGNAATASKLSTNSAYSAWGKTFWNNGLPKSISGDMSNVGNVTSTTSNTYSLGSSSYLWKDVWASNVHAGLFSFINGYQKSISSAGWYRFATSTTANNAGGTYMFFIRRSYTIINNEAYIISCIVDHGKVHWNLLNGHANTRLITQVRCTYTNDSTIYFDLYYNGAVSNTVYVNAVGDCTLQVPTATTSALTSTSTFDLGDGMIIDGNLLVKGGITMYATSSTSPITEFYASYLKVTGNMDIVGNINSTYYMLNNTVTNPYLKFTHTYNGADYIHYLQGYQGYLYLGAGCTNSLRISSDGSLYTPKTLTQGSDIRYKEVHKDLLLSLSTIADAPSFEFNFKDDEQKSTHIGTSAQYWQSVNGVVTEDSEGRLGMDYSSLGVVMGISLAKELSRFESDTDRRIRLLEEDNEELRREIEQLKYK